MFVSGRSFYNKIRSLRPDLANSIKPEILDKVCSEAVVQPFLNWFCDNISRANILSKEELQLKDRLQNTNEWLYGDELDKALEEAAGDNPELLKLFAFDDNDVNELFVQEETLKDICRTEENYIYSLRSNIAHLRELSFKLDDNIEEQQNILERECIEVTKAFNECSSVVEELDTTYRQFSKDIEKLLKIYKKAATNKGVPVLWTQMPIDLFIKQMKLYNDYLRIYIQRQFDQNNVDDEEQVNLDYNALMDKSGESLADKQSQEVATCKLNLTTSRIKEVKSKLQETSNIAMMECIKHIYNDGNVKVPSKTNLQEEILALSRKTNMLEEDVDLLERQLEETIQQYAEIETNKVLEEHVYARLGRKKIRLNKLKSLLCLTREHGHAHSDLLCTLMDMQSHKLKQIADFIADACYYFSTAYSLSSARCESMKQLQTDYESFNSSATRRNTFHRLFACMVLGNECTEDAVTTAANKYDDLLSSNERMKRFIFETYLPSRIDTISLLEKEVLQRYNDELSKSATASFTPIPYHVRIEYNAMQNDLQRITGDLETARAALKDRMKNNKSLKRDKEVLWQRFLTDPEELKSKYNEATQIWKIETFEK